MNRRITREHEIIRQARIRLGLSQQQVATLVSIQELDPYDLIFGTHPETVEELRTRRPAKGNLKVRHKS